MIVKKLRSAAGASLIAALFLFLFCAMTGTVILTAASANAGRLAFNANGVRAARSEAIDRDYYKVTSAAKLFAEQIKGKKVALTLTRTLTYDDYGAIQETDGEQYKFQIADVSALPDIFSAFLVKSVKDIYGDPDSGTLTNDELKKYWYGDFTGVKRQTSDVDKFTIRLADSALSGDILDESEIQGRITLDGYNCAVRAIFSSAEFVASGDSFQIPLDAYFVQLIVTTKMEKTETPVPLTDPDSGHEEITSQTITFTWDDAQILEGR